MTQTPTPNTIVADDDPNNPKRVLKDGETITRGFIFMDGRPTAAPLRDIAGRDAAHAAYVASVTDGWRSANTPRPDPTPVARGGEGVGDAGSAPTPYEQYVDHIQAAWKGKKHA